MRKGKQWGIKTHYFNRIKFQSHLVDIFNNFVLDCNQLTKQSQVDIFLMGMPKIWAEILETACTASMPVQIFFLYLRPVYFHSTKALNSVQWLQKGGTKMNGF